MFFDLLVAMISLFMTVHKANTIKEDMTRDDYLAWWFDKDSWATKVRKGATVGLDGIQTLGSAAMFVDSVSGGQIRTKAVRSFLDGFESPEDLKDKLSKVLGKSESIKKDNVSELAPTLKSPKISDDFANEHSIKTVVTTTSSDKECQDDSMTNDQEQSLSESSIESSNLDASMESSSGVPELAEAPAPVAV